MSAEVPNSKNENTREVDLGLGATVDLAKLVTAPARNSMANVNAVKVLQQYIAHADVDPESEAMLPELTEVMTVISKIGLILDQKAKQAAQQEKVVAGTSHLVTHGYTKKGTQVAEEPKVASPAQDGVAQDEAAKSDTPSPDLKWTPPTTPILGR